eukprot:Opistho-2@69790
MVTRFRGGCVLCAASTSFSTSCLTTWTATRPAERVWRRLSVSCSTTAAMRSTRPCRPTFFATALQLSPEQGMGFMVCGYVTFYFATWDEYHTEEMYLGPINGADEGVFLTYSFYFLTAVMGREAWLKPIAFGVPANIALTALSIVLSVGCWADAVRRVRAKRPTQIPAPFPASRPLLSLSRLHCCGCADHCARNSRRCG